jgi:hypothetical protein
MEQVAGQVGADAAGRLSMVKRREGSAAPAASGCARATGTVPTSIYNAPHPA